MDIVLPSHCLVFLPWPPQLLAEDAKVNADHRQTLASMAPTELEVTQNHQSQRLVRAWLVVTVCMMGIRVGQREQVSLSPLLTKDDRWLRPGDATPVEQFMVVV